VLHGITVDWVREDRTVPLASIRELSAIYSLRDILSGRYEVEQIHLDSIRLRLDRDSSGALILPVPDRLDADNRLSEPSEAELPEFVVHSLSLTDVNAVLVGPTDTVRLEDLFLSLAVQGRDETISIDLRRFGAELPGENLDLNITGGRVTISPDQYVFADLSLQSGLTMIRLDGAVDTRDGTSATVRYGIDNFDLEMLARVMKTKLDGQVDVNGSLVLSDGSLSGTTSIGGRFLFADLDNLFVAFRYADRQLALDTLYGTAFGTCGLQGRGHIDFAAVPEEYSLAAAIKSFDLLSVVPGAFASRLTGLVDLRGRAFTNEELRLDIDVDVHESSFDDFALHAAAGSMVVTVDSILFPEPFHVGYYDNDFWVSGRVDYSDTMALDVRADLRDTRRFGPYFFIEEPAGRLLAEAKITGRTSDPDLVARAVSDSAWIYGLYADSLEANLDVARFLSRQEGWVDVRAWRGEAWSAPFDSLRSSLTIDNNLVGIDSVAIWTPEDNLAGAGELDYEASPMDLRLDSLTVTAYDKRFRCDGRSKWGSIRSASTSARCGWRTAVPGSRPKVGRATTRV